MVAYWWDYIAMYPVETIVILTIAIGGYALYWKLSEFWNFPVYTTKYGEWRVLRYIGRLVELEDKASFKKEISKNSEHIGYIKISGQPKRKVILNSKDILSRSPNKIVMNKKYFMWDTNKSAYVFTDKRIKGYLSNPQNLERFMLTKIDNIDMKATRSARASPIIVHNSLLHQHVPLDSGMYTEKEDDMFNQYSDYIFDREEVGGYQTYEEHVDDTEEVKERRKDKRPLSRRPRGRTRGEKND